MTDEEVNRTRSMSSPRLQKAEALVPQSKRAVDLRELDCGAFFGMLAPD